MTKQSLLWGAATCALFALGANQAIAADEAPPPPAAPAAAGAPPADSQALLGEVVVTARKRTETLQDAPVAINAFGKKFIETFRIQNIQDLADFTPGLLLVEANTTGGNHAYLRGIGSQLDNAFSEGSVSLDVDGVEVPGEVIKGAQIDEGQIEVLRGPQALFYGKNSPGGVMSFESAAPTNTFTAGVTAGYEFSAQDKYVDGYVSGPITDTLTGRLAAHYSNEVGPWTYRSLAVPGYSLSTPIKNGPAEHDSALRATLSWKPNDKFDAIARLTFYDDERDAGVQTQRFNCTPGALSQPATGLPGGIIFPPAVEAQFMSIEDCKINNTIVVAPMSPVILAEDPLTHNKPLGYTSDQQFFLPVTMNYHITPQLTATSVTGLYAGNEMTATDFSNQPGPIVYSDQHVRNLQMSEELRLLSHFDEPLNFLAGVYLEGSQINYRQGIVFMSGENPPTLGVIQPNAFDSPQGFLVENARQTQRAYSPFLQGIYQPIKTVELDAGIRYSYEQKSVGFQSNAVPGVTKGLSKMWTNWSPEVTLRWTPTHHINIYGSYKEGFKSGGISASAGQPTTYIVSALSGSPINDTFNQETDRGFETGVKWSSDDDRFHLNLAGYRYTYKGLQLSNFNPQTVSITIENIGAAETHGAELDFNWRPPLVDGLTVYGGADWLHARYSNYIGDCFAGQSIGQGCNLAPSVNAVTGAVTYQIATATNGLVGSKQNLAGLPMKSAPNFTGTLGADYERPVQDRFRFGLSLDADFTDSYSADLADDPAQFQSAFWKLNASVRLSTMDQHWTVALIGRNLTNVFVMGEASKDFIASAPNATGMVAPGPADYFGNVLWGREVRIEVSYKY